ncbi:cobyrinate a,c-diamide synthase [Zavarzinia aquatilis]|uniref:Cobyrinate a,c-diamide synthase n=1 Tax=Zavarzinia aquatilis TaxID=2211142 RepID=A0A317DU06_9PROT|nr:cobyrinate a,c-diamide synthase [Zavarzinia aquatilis]PWR18159.1 cobyrinic acid a,c-diamide synthase [Zavarzinia aquatilis]
MPPGLMIAAPASGSGKTTVMLGLARAFRDRGVIVQPYKSGPDYIDPGFHAAAAGRPSWNLDSWAMPAAMIDALGAEASGADLVLAEGSMGLYDGVALPGVSGSGASADIARRRGWPVVLVLDVSGQAQTAAAVALGLARFQPDVRIAGAILNRVASPRHEALVRAGMAQAGIAVLGALPRRAKIEMPERHLGLVQAEEHGALEAMIAEAADFVADNVDLDALRRAAVGGEGGADGALKIAPPGQRIALARDAAFSFVYPHMLAGWRRAGAEILPFSPLADQAPDGTADVCWLPGGYPELHAGRLAAAPNFRAGLRRFAATRPVHGECGGYMVMGSALIDAEGVSHEMARLLGLVTSYAARRMHLGYRRAQLLAAMPGFPTGGALRGHEFHYSSVVALNDPPLAQVVDAAGAPVTETGSRRGLATGTFFHLIAGAA